MAETTSGRGRGQPRRNCRSGTRHKIRSYSRSSSISRRKLGEIRLRSSNTDVVADSEPRHCFRASFQAGPYLHRVCRLDNVCCNLPPTFTGLEALFTPRKADIFYPTAATIGYGVIYTSAGRDDPAVRLATWKGVKDLYAKRSRLVHGDELCNEVPHGVSSVEKMLVESIGFCVLHTKTILACGGIPSWLDKVRFGVPEALEPGRSLQS